MAVNKWIEFIHHDQKNSARQWLLLVRRATVPRSRRYSVLILRSEIRRILSQKQFSFPEQPCPCPEPVGIGTAEAPSSTLFLVRPRSLSFLSSPPPQPRSLAPRSPHISCTDSPMEKHHTSIKPRRPWRIWRRGHSSEAHATCRQLVPNPPTIPPPRPTAWVPPSPLLLWGHSQQSVQR